MRIGISRVRCAGPEASAGPVTHGVLVVGHVDMHCTERAHMFGRTVPMPSLGLGDAVHWANATHRRPLRLAESTHDGQPEGSGQQQSKQQQVQ